MARAFTITCIELCVGDIGGSSSGATHEPTDVEVFRQQAGSGLEISDAAGHANIAYDYLAIAILVIVDAAGFHGRYRQAAWDEAQTRAYVLNHDLNRIIAGLAR